MDIDVHVESYSAYGVSVHRPCARADGAEEEMLRGYCHTVGRCVPDGLRLLAFASDWGREFTPQDTKLSQAHGAYRIETVSGRCSQGYQPCLFLCEAGGRVLCVLPCWSGNWYLEVTPQGEVRCGQTAQMLTVRLKAGETLALPAVITAECRSHGTRLAAFNALSASLHAFLEREWLPPSRVTGPLVEWNHWWRYEDAEITEEIFKRNVDAAAGLGVTLCTLDAGWFGDGQSPVHWTKGRGDWNCVNAQRFPGGLRALAGYVHAKGMKFGLWVEPEAMGEASALRRAHPEWEARRAGAALAEPYLCLGADGAAQWLFEALDGLVSQTGCDWLKLDFNVSPGFGCSREDHGHGFGDGLYCHYKNYYAVLDRLREKHPALILENCSSGGMRLDLEMLRHTDVTFLSDPDETRHSLQCFWAASLFVPLQRLLHWTWSQTRQAPDGSAVFPGFSISEDTPVWKLQTVLRASMFHPFGFSRDLTALPESARAVIRAELTMYRETLAPLLAEGRLYRCSPQPLRAGARTDDRRLLPRGAQQDGPTVLLCIGAPNGKIRAAVFVAVWRDEPEFEAALDGLDSGKSYRAVSADGADAQLLRAGSGHRLILPAMGREHSALYFIGETQEKKETV